MAIDNGIVILNLKNSVENVLYLPYKSPKLNEQNHLSLPKITIKVKK